MLLVNELVDMASQDFDENGEFSWDSSVYALLETQEYLEENPNLIEFDENPLIDSYEPQKALFVCAVCQRTYKTIGGHDRHMRAKHAQDNNAASSSSSSDAVVESIDDKTITEILMAVFYELSSDKCYPHEIREQWRQYNHFSTSPLLNENVKILFSALKETSNAERFQERFYSQLLYRPTYFQNLRYELCVEVLRKMCDKLLAHYQASIKPHKGPVEITALTVPELDALDYVGGYVLRKVEFQFARKRNQDAIQVVNCFKSETNEDQPLINMLDRGGLIGITQYAKTMFLKAEHFFRYYTLNNQSQNIHIPTMVDFMMTDIEVQSCSQLSIEALISVDDEILQNVVEAMLTLYYRVRSFSHVRDLSRQKKKEKAVKTKEKALRKELKGFETGQ